MTESSDSLPPRPYALELPPPTYAGSHGFSKHHGNPAHPFFAACSQGDLLRVHHWQEQLSLSIWDLDFGLEEATQNMRVEVARYLLLERHVRLHCRCFCRMVRPSSVTSTGATNIPSTSAVLQSIFTSGSNDLLCLLKLFLEGNWHPNTALMPLEGGYLEPSEYLHPIVALHYPRCLQDEAVLRLLLDAGADPNIAMRKTSFPWSPKNEPPGFSMSGHILEMGIRFGNPDTVALLLSHGAKLEHAAYMHCLVRRSTSLNTISGGSRTQGQADSLYVGRSPPPLPSNSARLEMANYLLKLGSSVNETKDIYYLIAKCHFVDMPHYYETTPLLHAALSGDWEFVEWLAHNGADVDMNYVEWEYKGLVYDIAGDMKYIQSKIEDSLLRAKRNMVEIITE